MLVRPRLDGYKQGVDRFFNQQEVIRVDVIINFNDEVKVKLTEVGIEIMQEQRRELNSHIQGNGGIGLGELELKTDDDGYTRFQLWDLMNRFGQHMRIGHPEPFEGTMIFPQLNLNEWVSTAQDVD
ncbi:hypothetical protein MKY95_21085 [Paenibacillus sp. FSL P4-0176]|uniref:hypothetical protein n=1 Tax=Paenibacillus sp. FSL P4-0176 TaxID=2921631 RepID=UPI0030D04F30